MIVRSGAFPKAGSQLSASCPHWGGGDMVCPRHQVQGEEEESRPEPQGMQVNGQRWNGDKRGEAEKSDDLSCNSMQ